MVIKRLRVAFLLFVLILVAAGTWLSAKRSTAWDRPLWVGIYPIGAEGDSRTRAYVDSLTSEDFAPIEMFFEREARRHGLELQKPFVLRLYEPIVDSPPDPPRTNNPFLIGPWSLRLRWWAWRRSSAQDGPKPDIRMFVVYHDPERRQSLSHSLGLQKGLVGVVNAFGTNRQREENQVVIAHELLHTLGATDKYYSDNNYPIYPIGFSEPDRWPPLPQRYAEIMGGRRPLDNERAVMPNSLRSVTVGVTSATEIGWL